jgi:putative spermidine/putrescine transport system substrate-binding protein
LTTARPVARVVRVVARLAIVAIVASACGNDAPPGGSDAAGSTAPPSAVESAAPPAGSDAMTALVAAAEQEGHLTTIALAHDWCNYGEALTTFTTRYGIAVDELTPDATFDDQLQALKDAKSGGPTGAPDVVDIGPSFAVQAKAAKLLAPYKVSTWDTVPAAARDPGGFWTGDYFGVLAFETNTVGGLTPPSNWSDLLDPQYAGKLALAGDPRVTTQAIETVYAAALANGGSLDDAKPGLDFFAKLQKAGILLPAIATPDLIDRALTPISIRWTYNALPHRDSAAGSHEIDVTVPATGRLGSYSVQAISAYAPHPNAARLWLEFLYSDDGQNLWLKGDCTPIRYDDLVDRSVVPVDLLANLPDMAGTVFPTLAQLTAASTLITQKWNAVVGADIH